MAEQIAGAPTARTADVRGLPTGQVQAAAQAAPQPPITELFAPTTRPGEPITSGVAVGPGPGPEVMGYAGQSEKLSDILSQMLPYDTDGEIAILYQQAVSRGL
jgi:hypothetical protein